MTMVNCIYGLDNLHVGSPELVHTFENFKVKVTEYGEAEVEVIDTLCGERNGKSIRFM